MVKTFISYHHGRDYPYKQELLRLNSSWLIFEDLSVEVGEISDDLSDLSIRSKIRDEYLRESTVTVVLVGLETRGRKHVDWEIYSSMFDGVVNKKSGILVVILPEISTGHVTANTPMEQNFYPRELIWAPIRSSEHIKSMYPNMPERLVDNLETGKGNISVVEYSKLIREPIFFRFLIESAHEKRAESEYDLSRPMRRANSPSGLFSPAKIANF